MATPARIVAAGRGARWLGEGWRLFRAAPLSWVALVFVYWLLMTVVSLLPYLGIAAASVLVPPFAVGFMAASRAAASGSPLGLDILFSGFRENLRGQLALGLAYLACLALLIGATTLVDGGALAHWMLVGEGPRGADAESGSVLGAMLVAVALYAPVMMMFWFAPVLVAWHGIGAVKALFFSFLACLINWRAFLAYGAAAILLTVVAPTLALSALLLMSGGRLAVPVTSFLFPLLLVMLPTLLASFYVSYRDVFGTPESD
ncbi:MAG TPA: BPSS1780 family membrane protein [Burkholderiales bacterium]|nr:BPSS1780 family membrane protein [Burkholderiales bacterium]